MKMIANVPRLGEASQYIGKPFNYTDGKVIGRVIECVENGEWFKLTIDADFDTDTMIKNTTFSIEVNKKCLKD